jgi:hypothetical protein
MTCQDRIQALQSAITAIDTKIAQLQALPDSNTDPGIIAAIQQLQAQETSLKLQLATEQANCTSSAPVLAGTRLAAAKKASAVITRTHAAARKSAVDGAGKLTAASKDLLKAIKPR